MCNCVSEISNRLQNELPKENKNYKDMKVNDVSCDCVSCVLIGKKIVSQIAIPFTLQHEPIKRKKSTTLYMTIKFCPFCGEEVEHE